MRGRDKAFRRSDNSLSGANEQLARKDVSDSFPDASQVPTYTAAWLPPAQLGFIAAASTSRKSP